MFPLWLAQFVKWFNFVERKRFALADAAKERALERQHQLLLFEGVLNKAIELAKTNNEAIVKLAEAQAATANAFTQWLKGFQVPDAVSGPMPNTVMRDEDSWELPDGTTYTPDVSDLPAEFQLAAKLHKMNEQALGDFDREGNDFA